MADQPSRLPGRMIGANLPAAAYLTASAGGRTRPPDDHGRDDDKVIRFLLNGLRRRVDQ